MKFLSIVFYILITCTNSKAQTTLKDRVLYGVCKKDSLTQAPYDKWFLKNAADYIPNATTIAALQKINYKNINVQIFFGSWCGDSKREVPKFYKILEQLNITENKVQLIALGGSDSLYKQSPTGEEQYKGIFRVPVFIVYKNGKEIGRVNEFPATSIESDLLQIISNETYTPNYASFASINKWLQDGILKDDNTSAVGLANQIRNKVSNENELNSLGYLLLKRNMVKEALKIFKINYNLYSTSTNIMSSLGEAFLKNKENEKAVVYLEMALQENKNKEQFKEILKLLYEAKGVKK